MGRDADVNSKLPTPNSQFPTPQGAKRTSNSLTRSAGSRTVAVAFGSNLGDRRRRILDAAERVSALLASFRLSTIVETAPEGAGLENDPPYLNAVGVGTWSRSARELFEALRAIETAAGRTRPHQGAPRTLDLDLILVGDEVVSDSGLQVPHPRFRDRLFVLGPLAEIAPDLKDPITGRSIRDLLARCKRTSECE